MTARNRYSARITQPRSQGASQAILHGTGLTDAQMNAPQVGITTVWYEGSTCNLHTLDLAAEVKAAAEAEGLVAYRASAMGVNDAISMGTEGMRYSLPSRDLIADSIETLMAAHWYDANVSIPACDKNLPGSLMAIARLDRPSMVVFAGTIAPGCLAGEDIDVISAFQSYGALLAGSAFESRDGRWFEVTPAMAGQIPAPTDAQLNAFIQENADRLRAPEFRMRGVEREPAVDLVGDDPDSVPARQGENSFKVGAVGGPAGRIGRAVEENHPGLRRDRSF